MSSSFHSLETNVFLLSPIAFTFSESWTVLFSLQTTFLAERTGFVESVSRTSSKFN